MNVKDLDLNLLVALEKLIELKSVSQAAKEMGVTQPAMSNILARIRRTFDDEILVKVGREMDLTPKAKEFYFPLKSILQSIQTQIIENKPFNPLTDSFHFKLAFHDYEQLIIHSQLLPLMVKTYPHISMEHVPPRSIHPTEDLGSGLIDFSTGPRIKDRAGILRKRIFSDQFVCLADKRNRSLKKKKLTTQLYSQLEHLFISPHGGMSGQADVLLQKRKRKRFVRMSVTDFSTAPWLLFNTDLIVTLPHRVAEIYAFQHKSLEIFKCPVDIEPVEIYLSWHERINNSDPHMWFKNLIINLLFESKS